MEVEKLFSTFSWATGFDLDYLNMDWGYKPPVGKNMKENHEYVDVGRNDPCPCGSGKKYKKCCLKSGKYEKYVEVRSEK